MNPTSSAICTPCGYVKIQNKNKIISNIKSKNQNNIKQILSDLCLASYKRYAVATSVSHGRIATIFLSAAGDQPFFMSVFYSSKECSILPFLRIEKGLPKHIQGLINCMMWEL